MAASCSPCAEPTGRCSPTAEFPVWPLRWADSLVAGRPIPADYPPGIIHLIAWGSELSEASTTRTLRALQVAGKQAVGPAAYLAWRLVLAPGWALAVTLVATLPLLEPYKPYTTVVLVVLVPVLIALLSRLRRVAEVGWGRIAARSGHRPGAGPAVRLYSGWFVWSAPGAVAAGLALFPWRGARTRAVALLGGGCLGGRRRGAATIGAASAAGTTTSLLLLRHRRRPGVLRDVAQRPAR